jgi:GNAT superfamily N-acetyltransferase
MSVIDPDVASSVIVHVTRRWQASDPLLPRPQVLAPGCGTGLTAPAAVATCEHWEAAPGSLDLSWGAARRFKLTAALAGPDLGPALDRLLSLWRDHLATVPGADQPDTAAIVTWPSRDIDGVATLLRRGLAPLAVIAARPTRQVTPSPAPQGMRIRRAGPADIDAVVGLGLEVVRYDAHFGGVVERPVTPDALRREATGWLAEPEPWTWLAERDGTPIGMLTADRPERAAWIAPMVALSPAAYLMLAAVLPGERGTGVGAALVARYHREIEAAGIAVTLLHYAQLNPLSAPFWHQQGYRPLWTVWETHPARALR